MEINVNLKPEDVNKAVAEAIINSAIGTSLKAAIAKHLEAYTRTWDNPLEPVLKAEINRITRDLVETRYRPQIEAKVKSLVTDALVEKIFDKLWVDFTNKTI